MWSGDVMDGSRDSILSYLEAQGFTHLDRIAMDDLLVKIDHNGVSPAVSLKEVMTTKAARACQYLMVPAHRLPSYCREMFPRNYFARAEGLPECLWINTTPYTWDWILAFFAEPACFHTNYCRHFHK